MSHKHFTPLERIKLEGFLDEKISIVACAKKLDKNPSSIHAEIKRNRLTKTEFNR
ncbi:helix-turn-helix domain-containing protein, partial [Candidatus Saccharibacteria bacterium]|nr:helix-turn-helix domain-containing protein [Candidatus Saccharibacteria bacterium]